LGAFPFKTAKSLRPENLIYYLKNCIKRVAMLELTKQSISAQKADFEREGIRLPRFTIDKKALVAFHSHSYPNKNRGGRIKQPPVLPD
jgi:hypothetical protein